MTRKKFWTGGAILLAVGLAPFSSCRRPPGVPPAESFVLPPTGRLTIAAGGDIVINRPVARSDRDTAFEAIVAVVRSATLAITNLEMNLLAGDRANAARGSTEPRWTFGSTREAAELKGLGFDLVGQANNHATDYGPEGMMETSEILTASGLMPAGSGRDLGHARAPVFAGGGPRKIAVLAVAISSSPESVATPTRGIINGRPGINPLRYAADVTVDARSYETLRRSAPALQGGSETGSDQFTLLGTNIKKGVQTAVNLVPDARDVDEILAQIGRARATAEVVVLSVHSHEPSNDSDRPAEFFEDFARRAIDAGAGLVVGHGPHRLRGVEIYNGGAILYSVGDFLFQPEPGQPPLADPYDAGLDMYSLAMGIPGRPAAGRPEAGSAERWEGAVAVASFEAGALQALQMHPVDLGVDLPPTRKGIPRKPASPRAVTILETLARLSQRYTTTIRIENGVGIVVLD